MGVSIDVQTLETVIEIGDVEITEIAEQGLSGPPGPQGNVGPTGVNWLGNWSSLVTYIEKDGVYYNNSSWRALRENTNVPPSVGLDWHLIAAGGSGSDVNYVHNQIAAATLWTINHGLGKKPSVTIVDTGDNVWLGDIVYVDDNTLTVEFSFAFSGKAYLN